MLFKRNARNTKKGFFWGRGGGVVKYVPPQRVGFLRRFGLKTGIDFAHFGLELGRSFSLGMMYEGTTIVYQRVRRQAFPNEQERERNMRTRNGF